MWKILTSLSAAGRRFWLTVAIFALVNAGMWIAYHHFYQASRRHLLRVESFLPGDGATVGHRPILSWRFNLDVARETDGPPGQKSPHVPGRWEWRDARTQLFHAEQDLARATRYSVSLLDDRLSTPEGFRLNRPQVWTIQTPALRVLEARQAGFLENGRYLMEVQFSDEVIPANGFKSSSGRCRKSTRPSRPRSRSRAVR